MISQIRWSAPRFVPGKRHLRPAGPSNRSGTALGRNIGLRVLTNAIKTVDHNVGLDTFLLKAMAENLSPKALDVKRAIQKKKAAEAPVAQAS